MFVKKNPPPHHCDPPTYANGIGKGTIWQCPCGKQYRLIGVMRHSRQACWSRKWFKIKPDQFEKKA